MSDCRGYSDYFPMLVAWYGGRMTYLEPIIPIKWGSNKDSELIHYFLREWKDIPLGDFDLPGVEGVYKVQAWCELWFSDSGRHFNMRHPEYIRMLVIDYNTLNELTNTQEYS